MSNQNTPEELAAQLDAARDELDVLRFNRTRLNAQLDTAQDDENRVRALVKSGDVAASELAKPQGSAHNLRELIAELDTEIAAQESTAEQLETDLATANRLAVLVAVAERANDAAARLHVALNNACELFENAHPAMRQARDDYDRARSEFQVLAMREIDRRPPEPNTPVFRNGSPVQVARPSLGQGAKHDAQLAGAVALLREIAEVGANTVNVWATLPSVQAGFGVGNNPVSNVPQTSRWSRALMEVFENDGAVVLVRANQ
jgi:hypothetical protein